MVNAASKTDVDLLIRMLNVLHSWSGLTDETPDDYEVLSCGSGGPEDIISTADLRDAFTALNKLNNMITSSKDGVVKFTK